MQKAWEKEGNYWVYVGKIEGKVKVGRQYYKGY